MKHQKQLSAFEKEVALGRSIYGPQREGRIMNTSYIRDSSEESSRNKAHGEAHTRGNEKDRKRSAVTE